MSVRRPTARSRALAAVALGALVAGSLSGCEVTPSDDADASSSTVEAPAEKPPVAIATNVERRDVPVDRMLEVTPDGGTLTKVTVTSKEAGRLAGKLKGGGARWVATGRLEPGTTYVVRTVARRPDGSTSRATRRFTTEDLSLDQQTWAAVAPLDGETVGVGMPVIVSFDIGVTDKAAMERHMKVTSTPQQKGSWHWLNDNEAHWRPASYWQAGTQVSVDLDINSIPAGAGIYGQESRHVDFTVGDAHVYKVDVASKQMRVYSNGSLLRTIPISAGKPGFETRSGVKVVVEKHEKYDFNSGTIGIDVNDAEGYDLKNVPYAMRLTYSGEFIHAAPWNQRAFGNTNGSHGCTGMSKADAGWLFDMTRRGDVVEYTGTDKWMTLENGFGDWNLSFADYRQGSALS